MPFPLPEEGIIDRTARLVFQNPFLREPAALNLVEDPLHFPAGLIGDDPGPAGHVSELGGVADGVAHIRDPTLVDEIHDQLHLVQAFKVGHLGRVAGLDQRLISRLDQRGQPPAEHHLLPEQIGLAFLAERRLDDARACSADRLGVGQTHFRGILGGILVNRQEHRDAASVLELGTDQVAGPFGGDHKDIDIRTGNNLAEVDIKPVGEGQIASLPKVRHDLVAIQVRLEFVGGEDHDDLGQFGRLPRRNDLKARPLGLLPGLSLPEPDHDRHPAVF